MNHPISSTILDSLTSNVPNVPMHPMNGASTVGIVGLTSSGGTVGGASVEDSQRCFICGYGGCDIRISPSSLSVHAVSDPRYLFSSYYYPQLELYITLFTYIASIPSNDYM